MVRIISVIASSITSVQWWHVKPEHENIFAFYLLAGRWLMAKFSLEPLNVLAMLELWAVRVRIVITVGRRHYHLRTPDTVICPGTFLLSYNLSSLLHLSHLPEYYFALLRFALLIWGLRYFLLLWVLWYFGFSELWHFVTLESFARPTQVEASSPDL